MWIVPIIRCIMQQPCTVCSSLITYLTTVSFLSRCGISLEPIDAIVLRYRQFDGSRQMYIATNTLIRNDASLIDASVALLFTWRHRNLMKCHSRKNVTEGSKTDPWDTFNTLSPLFYPCVFLYFVYDFILGLNKNKLIHSFIRVPIVIRR